MMKKRPTPFDTKLARIREIEEACPPTAATELRGLLGEKDPYLTGRAAKAAAELVLPALIPDLAATFHRLASGEQPDPSCVAALEVVRALARLEADVPQVYLAGIRMERRTRLGDSAAPIRVESALALVSTNYRDAVVELTPLLLDPEAEVRTGAARAIGATGGDPAAAVLYFKLLVSDADPEVLGACMTGLLHVSVPRFLPIIARRLDDEDEHLAEVAALALGDSRAPEALKVLRRSLEGQPTGKLSSTILLAMALLRQDEATGYLLEVLETAKESLAAQALSALAIHKHVASVGERVKKIVEARSLPRLREGMAEKFGG